MFAVNEQEERPTDLKREKRNPKNKEKIHRHVQVGHSSSIPMMPRTSPTVCCAINGNDVCGRRSPKNMEQTPGYVSKFRQCTVLTSLPPNSGNSTYSRSDELRHVSETSGGHRPSTGGTPGRLLVPYSFLLYKMVLYALLTVASCQVV